MPTETLASGATFTSFDLAGGSGRQIARAQNFIVEWISQRDRLYSARSDNEMIVLLAAGIARLGDDGEIVLAGASVAILPAGVVELMLVEGGPLLVLATGRSDLDGAADAGNTRFDPRIAPIGVPLARRQPIEHPVVTALDDLPNPSGNPRIRFLQSETMSINIVRYDGPRDATSLSPHAHDDIQQGTLAIAGHYVHHLRTPWGRDVAEWREDQHIDAGPGTLLLIPPEIVHTTQGVGAHPHLMLDIFAPARRDFIAKGWMANADDYLAPA
ncbi:hypothetical protein DFR49_2967 [Hephaestia caeni]|uniref:Mannose-6-phosphate isomerase-like protein (Cupin superfamily) n=1 Tax=Hephaestia caeni TaxID=645617 RepID=A0A397NHS8_9SPHN|nr:hypothetical protein [Hephaestia caeni]RIA37092.1 hypothetical protein DFR49_2967 [Hephaestia caeni]